MALASRVILQLSNKARYLYQALKWQNIAETNPLKILLPGIYECPENDAKEKR